MNEFDASNKNDPNKFYYHITLLDNLESILEEGILPNLPADMENEITGVYLFRSIGDAENAMLNWMGERFDETDELVMLKIDPVGIDICFEGDFESVSCDVIPPENILSVFDEDLIERQIVL